MAVTGHPVWISREKIWQGKQFSSFSLTNNLINMRISEILSEQIHIMTYLAGCTSLLCSTIGSYKSCDFMCIHFSTEPYLHVLVMVCLPWLLTKRIYAARGEIFQAALVAPLPTFHQNQKEVDPTSTSFSCNIKQILPWSLLWLYGLLGLLNLYPHPPSIFTSLILVSRYFLSLWKLCIRSGQRVLNWKDWILVFVYHKMCLLHQIYSLHVEKTCHSSRRNQLISQDFISFLFENWVATQFSLY